MKNFRLLFLIVLGVSSCYIGEELPPDQDIWEYDQPSNVALSEDILLDLNTSIQLRNFEEIQGMIILKDDKLVFENYFFGEVARNTPIDIDDASAAITVILIAIAEEQNLLDLDDPIHQYLPSYSSFFEAQTAKEAITIRHLITHQSGISWGFTTDEEMMLSSDWISFILDRPLEATPGIRYNFNIGGGTILAKILENATDQSFMEFANENLFNTIGVTSFQTTADASGNVDGGSGHLISLIDWTKFGYLVLNEGIWQNRRIIDPNFIAEARTPQVQVSQSFNVGLGWNVFGDSFDNFLSINRENIFYSAGDLGQHLYIIPEHDMVVAIFAENFFFGFSNPSLNLFLQITTAI